MLGTSDSTQGTGQYSVSLDSRLHKRARKSAHKCARGGTVGATWSAVMAGAGGEPSWVLPLRSLSLMEGSVIRLSVPSTLRLHLRTFFLQTWQTYITTVTFQDNLN